jgi:hypothetical protein
MEITHHQNQNQVDFILVTLHSLLVSLQLRYNTTLTIIFMEKKSLLQFVRLLTDMIYSTHMKVIAWHEYTRVGRTKQWDDDNTWVDRNNKSHKRNRELLGVDGESC